MISRAAKKIKTQRPPNIAISLLLLGFGLIHTSNLLIPDSYIRSIIMGVAQSLIFVASVLRKNDGTANEPSTTIPAANDPFTMLNPNPIEPIHPSDLPATVIASNHDGVLASDPQIVLNV